MARIVYTEDIQPGMMLSKSILNRFGQIILPEGTRIEEKHKRVLKTWRVKSIYILDAGGFAAEEETEAEGQIKDEAVQYLKRKMKWEPRNENEINMFNVAIKRIMQKISKKADDID